MKQFTLIVTLSLFIVACGGNSNVNETSTAKEPGSEASTSKEPSVKVVALIIQTEIPYAKDNDIAQNIKDECQLPSKLSKFIKIYAEKKDINVNDKPSVSKDDPGGVLIVEITDAVSSGNAFIGHRKFAKIKGELYKDGQLVGSFVGKRHSGGGYGGGWKGSCGVLGRTVKALGKDISKFLVKPKMDAKIGER